MYVFTYVHAKACQQFPLICRPARQLVLEDRVSGPKTPVGAEWKGWKPPQQ